MRTRLAAVATLAATAAILAAVAAAGPVAAKQHVAIQVKDGTSFVLTPLTRGAIKPDSGGAQFCCWTERDTMQNGQPVAINNPQMTLIGKQGTIVARNEIGWIDVPNGLSLFTGTWKVVRGTGVYAGLAGGGHGAGVTLASGDTESQFDGYLRAK